MIRYLTVFLLGMAMSGHAAVLNVTSTAPSNPGASSCPAATPCDLYDALRIAEQNGQDDEIRFGEPSIFAAANRTYQYRPAVSDLARHLILRSPTRQAVIDGGGYDLTLRIVATDGDITIDGVTFRNSSATYSDKALLQIDTEGDITLRNCNLRNITRAGMFGVGDDQTDSGARLVSARRVTIEDCTIREVKPDAVDVEADRVEVRRASFLNNGADTGSASAALAIYAHSALVEDSSFVGNQSAPRAYGGAGGLTGRIGRPTQPIFSPLTTSIRRNRFVDNTGNDGGGLWLGRSTGAANLVGTLEIDNNLFQGNRALGSGGGLYVAGDTVTRTLVRGNLVVGNELATFGQGAGSGIRAVNYGELHLLNNTVVSNLLRGGCDTGGVELTNVILNTQIQVHNNILRDSIELNCGGVADDLVIRGDEFSTVTLRNNNIGERRLFPGQQPAHLQVLNPLFSLPEFVDPAAGDFHLLSISTLIDAGSTASSFLPSTDMDGQARIQGTGVDVGADEFAGVPRRLVQLTKIGAGNGSVSSIPAGLSCPQGCTQATGEFDQGSTIGLLALPASGSVFSGWGGDCSGSNAGTTLLVSSNRVCTAQFEPLRYRVVVRARGTGQGDVGASLPGFPQLIYPLNNLAVLEDIAPGASVSFTAANFNGFFSTYWVNCDAQGGTVANQYNNPTSCSFNNLQGNKDITVEFRQSTVLFPTRTLNLSVNGTGQVSSQPGGINCTAGSCSSTFFLDTEVTLIAAAGPDSQFAGWTGDCSGTSPTTTVLLSVDRSCAAHFTPASQLSVVVTGNGGGQLTDRTLGRSVQYGGAALLYQGVYPINQQVSYETFADVGSYAFFLDCDQPALGMQVFNNGTFFAECRVNQASQNATVNLLFIKDQYRLTVSATGTGSGQLTELGGALALNFPQTNQAQTAPIDHGTVLTLQASGAGGSTIHWTGCSGQGAVVTGEGTGSSSCRLGLYEAAQVGVEFRGGAQGDSIFNNGFE